MNNRLTTGDLAVLLSKATGKDSERIEQFLREFTTVVNDALFADRIVKIGSIGTFKIIKVEKRESIDVNTKERITIPEHYKLSFIPDKEMRTVVNKPFEAFESIPIGDGVDINDFDTPVAEGDGEDDDDDGEIVKIPEIAQETRVDSIIIREEQEEEILPPPPALEFPESIEDESIDPPTDIEKEDTLPEVEEEEIITSSDSDLIEPAQPATEVPPPPPPSSPTFDTVNYEETNEPDNVIPEDLFPLDGLDESNDDPFITDESIYHDQYEYSDNRNEIEQILEEEDMEDFNGNRRKPDPVPYTSTSRGGSMTNNIAAVILAAVIVVLVIVLAFLLLKPTKHKTETIASTELVLPDSIYEDDNLIDEIIDDSDYPVAITPAPRPVPEKGGFRGNRKSSGSTAPAARYVAQTSVTTRQGDRLNLLSLAHYGDKVFWVYIYLANQSKLSNPDRIPVGITLTIPSSKDYDINSKSRLSLKKAYALQKDIIANYKASPKSSSSNGSNGYSDYGYDQSGGGQYGGGDQYGGNQDDYGNEGGDDYGDGSGDYGDGGYGSDDGFGSYDDGINLMAKPNSKKSAKNTKSSSKTPAKSVNTKATTNTKQQTKAQPASSRSNSVGRYL